MKVRVREVSCFIHNLRARMPFRYGIATMTRVPHLFLRLVLEIDGEVQTGFAADHLPPKWFTKNPATPYEDDVWDLLAVIRNAVAVAEAASASTSVFALWQEIYAAQKEWAAGRGFPPLLWSFGVSLIERAMIDATCRARKTTFARLVRDECFGLELGAIYEPLRGHAPAEFLPRQPLARIAIRHTVGMLDPLAERPADLAVTDGFPVTLKEVIETDGVQLLKIKLSGDPARDHAWLREVAALVGETCSFTLDGNENYASIEAFRASWERIEADPVLAPFLRRLIFVEQPVHRDAALSAAAGEALRGWANRPPIIIDESDGEIGTLQSALALGYAGGSHKNCKGVFKGIANACLIEMRRRQNPRTAVILSAEDLCNVGPVALLQDLAVVASLGIPHAERNGHHYFAGLSQFPRRTQSAVLAAHGDLYAESAGGFPALRIDQGSLSVGSVVAAPFGYAHEMDVTEFTPAEEWRFASLED